MLVRRNDHQLGRIAEPPLDNLCDKNIWITKQVYATEEFLIYQAKRNYINFLFIFFPKTNVIGRIKMSSYSIGLIL